MTRQGRWGTLQTRLVAAGIGLCLGWVCLSMSGCATVGRSAKNSLPPVTSFPPVQPSMVRLPINIIFPRPGDILQHLTNLVKGGFKQFTPNLYKLPGLNIEARIGDVWKEMQEPIYLEKDTWLVIQPETLSVGMVRTDLKRRSTLHTEMEMTAKPEIVFGPEPLIVPRKMPPLHRFKPGPGIFQAMSNTRLSYKEATQYLLDPRLKLIGMVFPGTGDRRLTLKGFRFSGSGGRVMVEVKLTYNPLVINFGGEPAKLTLYLSGTPRFREKERVVDFPDLDYHIQSGDLVVQVADWLNKSEFTKQLRRSVRIPLGPKLDLFKDRINLVLNKPLSRFTRLNTQVNTFRVLGAFADKEGIEMRLSIMGTASLDVIWN